MLNKPSPRLQILREQLARERFARQNDRELYAHSAANPRTTHHYHPDHDADLAEWLKSLDDTVFGGACGGGRSPKTTQSSASAWRRGTDIPVSERVGLWHNRCADGTVFPARTAESLTFERLMYRRAATGTKEGDHYDESRYATADLSARLADAGSAASGAALVGVKADTGLRHLVCVVGARPTGYVHTAQDADEANKLAKSWKTSHGSDWRLCDADGWIPHTPTADSTCPVPSGVHFETLLGCSSGRRLAGGYAGTGDCNFIAWDSGTSVIGWRPVAGGAAS